MVEEISALLLLLCDQLEVNHPVVNLVIVKSKRTVLRDRTRMALCIVGKDAHTEAAAVFACCGFTLQFIHCASGFCLPTSVDVACSVFLLFYFFVCFLAKTSVCAAGIAGGFEYSQRKKKIGLSTVKVHHVEPSVIVEQNVLRDFTTRGKEENKTQKKVEQTND